MMDWDRIKQWWKRQRENNLWQDSYRRWSDKMRRNSREEPASAWDWLYEEKLSKYWDWRGKVKRIAWEMEKEAGWTWDSLGIFYWRKLRPQKTSKKVAMAYRWVIVPRALYIVSAIQRHSAWMCRRHWTRCDSCYLLVDFTLKSSVHSEQLTEKKIFSTLKWHFKTNHVVLIKSDRSAGKNTQWLIFLIICSSSRMQATNACK